MRDFLKTIGRLVKFTALFLLLAVVILIVSVTFFEQPVPTSLLRSLTDAVSTPEFLVSAESASFRLAHGVKIRSFRLLDRRKTAAPPVMEAELADFELNIFHLLLSRKNILKAVTMTGFKYPRLGDGYYIPDSIEFPGSPDFQEKDEPLILPLPEIAPFRVKLIRPAILDVTPRFVEIPHVAVTTNGLTARGIHLLWSDSDVPMTLEGECALDLEAQQVRGVVHGQARQHNIRPLLVALDITNSYAFIDSFTKVDLPVDATCSFDVNLRNNDLHIFLDLHPTGGRYNNVPLQDAHGLLDIRVFVRDTFQNARIVVGPIAANIADGRSMTGTVIYENTNDIGYVSFDVRSTTSLSNALAVADVMTDGTLDCLVLDTPPLITLKGLLAVDPAHAATNDIKGTLAFDRGTFFSIPLRAASTSFSVRGTDITFNEARAAPPHGGTITGEGRISVPGFKQDNADFSVTVNGAEVSLADLAGMFAFDIGDRHGSLFGSVTLSGPLQTNLSHRVNGHGHIECRDGHLAQMRIFAGLTDFLAKHVPGIASFVNQSRGSIDFTISNGVFKTENIRIEGGFFSIHASGTYDIPKDKLDFTARVTFTRNEGFFAKLATPITWPFANLSKMLFDFKIFGTLDKPDWKYNSNLREMLK